MTSVIFMVDSPCRWFVEEPLADLIDQFTSDLLDIAYSIYFTPSELKRD